MLKGLNIQLPNNISVSLPLLLVEKELAWAMTTLMENIRLGRVQLENVFGNEFRVPQILHPKIHEGKFTVAFDDNQFATTGYSAEKVLMGAISKKIYRAYVMGDLIFKTSWEYITKVKPEDIAAFLNYSVMNELEVPLEQILPNDVEVRISLDKYLSLKYPADNPVLQANIPLVKVFTALGRAYSEQGLVQNLTRIIIEVDSIPAMSVRGITILGYYDNAREEYTLEINDTPLFTGATLTEAFFNFLMAVRNYKLDRDTLDVQRLVYALKG